MTEKKSRAGTVPYRFGHPLGAGDRERKREESRAKEREGHEPTSCLT